MNNQLNLHMELLEDVTAPGSGRDFVEGVGWGLAAVASVTAIVAFT
ncbi:daptide-type RiPP [Paenibacillus xanthanilyticus]|uniref:Daptide-type RiPP n=1 Tax=Paenibacillus xanthanilyticus TaxID=1783531 RepID=A0ABV8K019_9BACL